MQQPSDAKIHINEEDNRNTSKKFDAWIKSTEKYGLINNPDALKMLEDPAVYMYAFFKDHKGDKLKLYPYQDMIINDQKKRVIVSAANQIGKSITLCCKALHFALTNPGKTVLLVSKTLPQSKDLLREMRRLLNSSNFNWKEQVGDAENKTELYFTHTKKEKGKKPKNLDQSRIVCVPATEAALGYAADLLLLDELAFYDEGRYFFYQIAQPRTYTTKGQIIVFSNPNGQQGVFWELWKDADFSKYSFNFLDCPTNTLEEYQKLRKKLTRAEFDSTVDSKFTSPEGAFLTDNELKAMIDDKIPNTLPIVTQPIYVGLDLAKVKDRTVRVIGIPIRNPDSEDMTPHLKVLNIKEYPQGTEYTEVIDDLEVLFNHYKQTGVASVGFDATGVGKAVEEMLRNRGIPAVPVIFSLENKSRLFTNFKFLAEQKKLTMPNMEEAFFQFSQLRFKRNSRGYLQVHHENENDRDDIPDAVAILVEVAISPGSTPVSFTFIPHNDENENMINHTNHIIKPKTTFNPIEII
tara:strand:- start:1937 stop:3499 length:1563 start_codon:yes stop_codon:yes gene_type:complete